jgi:hypothetical protein
VQGFEDAFDNTGIIDEGYDARGDAAASALVISMHSCSAQDSRRVSYAIPFQATSEMIRASQNYFNERTGGLE